MQLDNLRKYFKGDWYIWVAIFGLMTISFLSVYSSTSVLAYQKLDGNTAYFIFKHTLLLLGGLGTIVLVSNIAPKYFSGFSELSLLLGVVALAAVLVMGSSINGSSRWLYIGSFSVQPSEFAKVALVLFISKQLARNVNDPAKAFWPVLMAVGLVSGLIVFENLSTCILVVLVSGVMMFIGRIPMKYIFGVSVIGLAFLVSVIVFAPYVGGVFPRAKTWHARVERFLDEKDTPESRNEDYQAQQALMAVATGGFMGKGPGNSYMKNFLPMAFSDFIFSIILEEYGIFGCIVIVLAYITIVARAVAISRKCDRPFHMFSLLGLSTLFVLQALINMSVGVGLIPVTGQTLPLVSMGGSSTLITCFAFGIIQSICHTATKSKAEPKPVAEPEPQKAEDEYYEEAEAIRF